MCILDNKDHSVSLEHVEFGDIWNQLCKSTFLFQDRIIHLSCGCFFFTYFQRDEIGPSSFKLPPLTFKDSTVSWRSELKLGFFATCSGLFLVVTSIVSRGLMASFGVLPVLASTSQNGAFDSGGRILLRNQYSLAFSPQT